MKDLAESKLYVLSGGSGDTTSFAYDLAYCISWCVTSMSIIYGRNAMNGQLAFK